MTITSRTLAAAEALAAELGATAVPWSELQTAAGAADIVVTATGANEPVLTRRSVDEVMRPRRHQPVFIIDIAVPRDVDGRRRRSRPGLPLQHRRPADHREGEPGAAHGGARRAEAIVDDEVTRFASWMQSRDIIPTVVALRERFEAMRQSELVRLEPKLAGLPPEARARIDEITRLIVEKLLLTPTEQLKAVSDEIDRRRLRRGAQPPVQAGGRGAGAIRARRGSARRPARLDVTDAAPRHAWQPAGAVAGACRRRPARGRRHPGRDRRDQDQRRPAAGRRR